MRSASQNSKNRFMEVAGSEPAKLPAAITVADLGAKPQVIHLGADPESQGGGSRRVFRSLMRRPSCCSLPKNSTGQRTALANVDCQPEQPTDGTCDCKSNLAAPFWVGTC